VARLAGLLAVAVLPAVAGIDAGHGDPLGDGFRTAMYICAGCCAVGGLVAACTIRSSTDVRPQVRAGVDTACQDAATRAG
jgi:hypothetical protein